MNATDWVARLSPWPEEFGLDTMRALLAELGHPERAFPAVHVVGTNGKSTATRTIAGLLRAEGLDVGVINARFAKPLDKTTILRAVEETPLVVTVEEGTLEGGFGSAVLEAANAAVLDTRHIVRLGIPDRFIEHAERGELLADLGLNVEGLCRTVRSALNRTAPQLQDDGWVAGGR